MLSICSRSAGLLATSVPFHVPSSCCAQLLGAIVISGVALHWVMSSSPSVAMGLGVPTRVRLGPAPAKGLANIRVFPLIEEITADEGFVSPMGTTVIPIRNERASPIMGLPVSRSIATTLPLAIWVTGVAITVNKVPEYTVPLGDTSMIVPQQQVPQGVLLQDRLRLGLSSAMASRDPRGRRERGCGQGSQRGMHVNGHSAQNRVFISQQWRRPLRSCGLVNSRRRKREPQLRLKWLRGRGACRSGVAGMQNCKYLSTCPCHGERGG